MSAQAGWYPDPGGGNGLYRYWDGKAWSAATSPYPSAPAPSLGLVNPSASAGVTGTGQGYGGQQQGSQGYASQGVPGSAYRAYQQTQKRRSPWGWWLAGAALVVAIVVVAVLAVRATTGLGASAAPVGGQGSQSVCPESTKEAPQPGQDPADGRVHGGPVSYPELGSPWGLPTSDNRVPFGTDVRVQTVLDQDDYDGKGNSWVASILVAELQAGDGFFTPEDGSKIVVTCILGTFYGKAAVTSDIVVNQQTTIDGHDGWLVESKLHFDIPGLNAKGERLIVAIVSAGSRSGLYYASIPDTRPELLAPARAALAQLTVDG